MRNSILTCLPASGIAAFLALAGVLVACGSKVTPLPPELQAIQCPRGHEMHATATFRKARITFLCINKELAATPYLLHCDRESRPMVCEDEGNLHLSRNGQGQLFVGISQGLARPTADDLQGGSNLSVIFRPDPPRTTTFEEEATDWKFLLDDGKRLLPAGFTFVKGTLCDREATPLNTGVCNIEATSASLYWHIAVAVHRPRGTPIHVDEYHEALAFWLAHLGRLVVDPAK